MLQFMIAEKTTAECGPHFPFYMDTSVCKLFSLPSLSGSGAILLVQGPGELYPPQSEGGAACPLHLC